MSTPKAFVPNLGELCSEDARRDCVHVAVAPVVAGMDLDPGWKVRLDAKGEAICDSWLTATFGGAIGVVDPFLKRQVKKGETFWLFLYPNTITGLRHVWTHDAFKPKPPERAT